MPIPFKDIIKNLKSDPKLKIQGSFHPANKLIYEFSRKKNYPKDSNEISTWDLRDIIYKANNYDPSKEPKIT